MANFAYKMGIPFRTNNPSDDQPDMLINNDSGADIWETDHRGFQVENGGTHKQNSYAAFSAGAVPVGDIPSNASVAYPAAGVADPTTAQYYFKTPKGSVSTSSLRAFGVFASSSTFPDNIPIANGLNVTGPVVQTLPGTGKYRWTIPIDPTIVIGTAAAVFITFDTPPIGGYTYSLQTPNLIIEVSAPQLVQFVINFMVVQI